MTPDFGDVDDLALGGGPVRVYRFGPPTGPVVVLLHGAGLDTARGVWRRVAPALGQAGYRVIAVDWPRHGGSRPWDGVLDDAFCRLFVEELLDQLEVDRCVLMGLSLGGGVAIGFALDFPERVRALVVLGPGGLEERRPWQFVTWAFLRVPGLLRWMTTWYARRPGRVRRQMEGYLVAGAATPDFDEIVRGIAAEAAQKDAHGERILDDWQIHAYGPFRMRLHLLPWLDALRCPSLWVRGERDQLVRGRDVEAAAEASGGRFVSIPDAGHIVTYDQPDAVIAETLRFLDEVAPANTGSD